MNAGVAMLLPKKYQTPTCLIMRAKTSRLVSIPYVRESLKIIITTVNKMLHLFAYEMAKIGEKNLNKMTTKVDKTFSSPYERVFFLNYWKKVAGTSFFEIPSI